MRSCISGSESADFIEQMTDKYWLFFNVIVLSELLMIKVLSVDP